MTIIDPNNYVGHPVAEQEPIYKVTDSLYQGSAYAMQDTVVTGDEFDMVVKLTPFKAVIDPRLAFVDFPLEDSLEGLTKEDFWTLYGICLASQDFKGVLMMCEMGENRSGLASVMYLFQRGYTVDEAIKLIRARVRPRSGAPYAFWNSTFEKQARMLLVR